MIRKKVKSKANEITMKKAMKANERTFITSNRRGDEAKKTKHNVRISTFPLKPALVYYFMLHKDAIQYVVGESLIILSWCG